MKGIIKFVVIAVLCVSVGYIRYVDYQEDNKKEYIAKSQQEIGLSNQWTKLIVESINREGINLFINGKEAEFNDTGMYMDKKRSIMIPGDVVKDVFGCSINIYNGMNILVEKADRSMSLSLGSSVISVNGVESELSSMPLEKNGSMFIPLEAIVSGLGYSFEWDSVENTAYLVTDTENTKNLPSYYSYVDKNKNPIIKNQLNLGTCWAFASLTALESTLLPERNLIFSADHISLNNSFNLSQYDGGEYSMAVAYLTAWQGPVLEKDDPYADFKTDDTLPEVLHVQEVQIIEAGDFDEIKRMIYQYGGVESSIYMSLEDSESTSNKHYNDENASYCYIGEEKPNHDVVIIGWDDDYAKENFNADVKENGAFICQNSWGEEFGDGGLIYVSYSDSNIGMTNVVYTGIENTDNYDNNYQSDLCGFRGMLGYDREYAYFANAYTAKGNEYLLAAGFYATGKDTEYSVYVCENFSNADSLANRKPVAKGKLENAGYYTIDFDEPVKVRGGQKFAIIVYIRTPNSDKPVAVELVKDYASKTVDLTDGEGYISINGYKWDDTEEEQLCNVCLKCYTKNID